MCVQGYGKSNFNELKDVIFHSLRERLKEGEILLRMKFSQCNYVAVQCRGVDGMTLGTFLMNSDLEMSGKA